MAIVMTAVIPASVDMYDSVNAELALSESPPDGLIAHYAAQADEGMLVFDVWESREQFEAFAAERLMPAMEKVMGGGAGVRPTIAELHDDFRR